MHRPQRESAEWQAAERQSLKNNLPVDILMTAMNLNATWDETDKSWANQGKDPLGNAKNDWDARVQ